MLTLLAQAFQIENPIGANNLEDIINVISSRLLEIVIPIAVIMYIWAGVNLLIAHGDPRFITRAKSIFTWTSVGLLVIFIGGGFVSLIRSILGAQ
jgi:hypothetical protein